MNFSVLSFPTHLHNRNLFKNTATNQVTDLFLETLVYITQVKRFFPE